MRHASIALLFLSGFLWTPFLPSALAQPTLTSLTPGAVQPGKTTEVLLRGTNLQGPLRVWTSFPAQVELAELPADAKDIKERGCKITLPAEASVGIGGMVIASAAGTSELLLVNVDDLPSVAEAGNNNVSAQAQVLAPPVAVDGSSSGKAFDYFRFPAKAGQRLSFEVVASRTGSAFDPVIRLLTADGKELRYLDDAVGMGADCRWEHRFAADGEYLIELHDNQYRGGLPYRLRVGDFPLVATAYPLGARLGSTAQLRFTGPADDTGLELLLRVPDQVPDGRFPVSVKYPNGQSSAAAVLATSSLPEAMETEPNNEAKTATEVTLPGALNGVIQEAGDRDCFRFPGVKGQVVYAQALTVSLGSPCLAMLSLLDAEGRKLAESNPSAGDELELTHTLPADGMYVLQVEELLRRAGKDFAYRVELRSNPGFSLSLKNDAKVPHRFVTPTADGGFALDVQSPRRGYDGPIRLTLEGAGDRYRLITSEIAAKAASQRVVIAVTGAAQPGELHALRLVGHASEPDGQAAGLTTGALMRTKFPVLPQVPAWMDGTLFVAVGAAADPLYALTVPAELAVPAAGTTTATFSVALERKNKDFKGGLNIQVQGLPAGYSAAVKAEGDRYDVTLTGPAEAWAVGTTLTLVIEGELTGRLQVLERTVKFIAPAA